MKLLKDRVCVITGSTKGIGLAIAKLFSREGAWVVINGRDEKRCNEITGRIKKEGGKSLGIPADISVRREVQFLFQTV